MQVYFTAIEEGFLYGLLALGISFHSLTYPNYEVQALARLLQQSLQVKDLAF